MTGVAGVDSKSSFRPAAGLEGLLGASRVDGSSAEAGAEARGTSGADLLDELVLVEEQPEEDEEEGDARLGHSTSGGAAVDAPASWEAAAVPAFGSVAVPASGSVAAWPKAVPSASSGGGAGTARAGGVGTQGQALAACASGSFATCQSSSGIWQ